MVCHGTCFPKQVDTFFLKEGSSHRGRRTIHRGFRLGAIETGHPPVLATWDVCISAKKYDPLRIDFIPVMMIVLQTLGGDWVGNLERNS